MGRLLRMGGIIIGAFVCVGHLLRRYQDLKPIDILCLGLLALAFRSRELVIRRNELGSPIISFHPGDSIIAIAMLRGGPINAMVVSGISMAVTLWTERNYPGPTRLLRLALNFTYYPALVCFGAFLYEWLGGHRMLYTADAALFFNRPTQILIPLFLSIVITTELINRVYQAALVHCSAGVTMMSTMTDPFFSIFEYVELLGAVVAVALYSAFGWKTIFYSALNMAALLVATRAYFQTRDSVRVTEVDPLTGVGSMSRLMRILRKKLASRRRRIKFALLFLDVDNLKEVNDRYGHAAGDELLRLIGKTCEEVVREPDVVCRRSGDEFLILLHDLDEHEGCVVRERLRDRLAHRVSQDDRFFIAAAGVSIGLSVCPNDGSDPDELIAVADRQMYVDKRERKSQILGSERSLSSMDLVGESLISK